MVSLPAPLTSLSISELLILLPLIAFPVYLIGRAYFTLPPASSSGSSSSNNSTSSSDGNTKDEKKEVKSVMQPPNADLQPPKDDPFTPEELQKYDGTDAEGSIYVAIKGTIFDVTSKRDMYGPGKSYNVFAGKDGSRGLGMSSLRPEDAVSDYSTLDSGDRKVLDDWHDFFSKRYNVVGRVVDKPSDDPAPAPNSNL